MMTFRLGGVVAAALLVTGATAQTRDDDFQFFTPDGAGPTWLIQAQAQPQGQPVPQARPRPVPPGSGPGGRQQRQPDPADEAMRQGMDQPTRNPQGFPGQIPPGGMMSQGMMMPGIVPGMMMDPRMMQQGWGMVPAMPPGAMMGQGMMAPGMMMGQPMMDPRMMAQGMMQRLQAMQMMQMQMQMQIQQMQIQQMMMGREMRGNQRGMVQGQETLRGRQETRERRGVPPQATPARGAGSPRLGALHDRLQIAEAQEAVWNAFVAAFETGTSRDATAANEPRRGLTQSLEATEHNLATRLDRAKKLRAAVDTLNQVLNETQRTALNQNLSVVPRGGF